MMRDAIAKEPRKRLQSLLLLFGFWTLLPFLIMIATDLAMGQSVILPSPAMILYLVLFWSAWAPLTLWITALGRRFPLYSLRAHSKSAPSESQWKVLKHALIHLVASWLVAVALGLYVVAITALLTVELSPTLALRDALNPFRGIGALAQILYWSVLAASGALAIYQRSRQRTALLAEARLESLKAQVHPHFLFNTLNTISTLIDEDADAAREMIAHLSELLRASLRGHAAQEVTLGEELELVNLYLEIEKVRFEDRLRLDFAIEDETRDALVPHLLLQPLVENAIRHGISRDSTAGELRLEAKRHDGYLRLRIEDDGPGPPDRAEDSPSTGGGIGLANVRARLEELYGQAGRLELRRRQPKGATVEVELPFHLRRDEVAA